MAGDVYVYRNEEMEDNNDKQNGLTLKKIFQGAYEIFGEGIKQTLFQKASELPEVKEAIAEKKIEAGKAVTWQVFPFLLIALAVVFLIKRF